MTKDDDRLGRNPSVQGLTGLRITSQTAGGTCIEFHTQRGRRKMWIPHAAGQVVPIDEGPELAHAVEQWLLAAMPRLLAQLASPPPADPDAGPTLVGLLDAVTRGRDE